MAIVALIAIASGCGGPGPSGSGQSGSTDAVPELSDEIIRQRLNYAYVTSIPEESGAAEPINWRFFENEPKEIAIVERNINGTTATVVLDIKTSSSPRSRDQRSLAGQIRINWELRSGMVLRQWEIDRIENLTMKYRNLPRPSPQPSNP